MKRIVLFSMALVILMIVGGFVQGSMHGSANTAGTQDQQDQIVDYTLPRVNETLEREAMAMRAAADASAPVQAVVLAVPAGYPGEMTPLQPAEMGIAGTPLLDGWHQIPSLYVNFPAKISIKDGTHPAIISRKPGTLDMIYFHPDNTPWWVNRSGGYVINWSSEAKADNWADNLFSPAIYSWGPDQITLIETDEYHCLWIKNWTESGGWSGGSYIISNGDVNSTPAAITRDGGNLEIVYYNITGYLISQHYNKTSNAWTSKIIDDAYYGTVGNNDGVSIVSASPDSFMVIQRYYNFLSLKTWTQWGGWSISWNDLPSIPAYSYPAASVRSYADAGVQNTTIDFVSNDTSPSMFYWRQSYDGGHTWNNVRTLTFGGSSPVSIAPLHFNRLEMLKRWSDGFLVEQAWKGPDISRIGVFRNGFWILDGNGNYQWDGTGSGKDIVAGFGQTGDKPVVKDWNGDGRSEIAVFRPGTGQWIVDYNGNYGWDGTGPGQDITVSLGQNGDIPVAGDWMGTGIIRTGKDKIGVFRNGFWILDANGNFLWDGTGSGKDIVAGFGQTGDIPVVGDWNGNGQDKIGVFRNGFWILDTSGNMAWSGTPADTVAGFGQTGDVPVPKDWNGDGKPEIAVFRPSTGQWIIDYNGNYLWDGTGPGQDVTATLGQNGDVAVTGNWNVMSTDKFGVFRNGFWILDYNGNLAWDGPPTDKVAGFGQVLDIPVVGDWR